MNSARWSGSIDSRPLARKRCSCSAVSPPSRPFISNSRRSKFDDTWMSMLGLSDGTTGAALMSLWLKNRSRMSLALEATTSWSMGAPMRRAIQPLNTLPKLPLGTHTLIGPASRSVARDVVDDLRHHPRPVDAVDRAQLHALAELGVVEHRLHHVLAVVERAVDGHHAHVGRLAPWSSAGAARRWCGRAGRG